MSCVFSLHIWDVSYFGMTLLMKPGGLYWKKQQAYKVRLDLVGWFVD